MLDLPHYADLLLARKRAVEHQLASAQEDLARLASERSASTSDDEHDPEGSTLSSDWSQLTGLSRSQNEQLRLIDAAKARIDHGTYGACLNCGMPIAERRLDARPEAELCMVCAAALQR